MLENSVSHFQYFSFNWKYLQLKVVPFAATGINYIDACAQSQVQYNFFSKTSGPTSAL